MAKCMVECSCSGKWWIEAVNVEWSEGIEGYVVDNVDALHRCPVSCQNLKKCQTPNHQLFTLRTWKTSQALVWQEIAPDPNSPKQICLGLSEALICTLFFGKFTGRGLGAQPPEAQANLCKLALRNRAN